MDAHRIVGGNRPIKKRPSGLTAVFLDEFLETPLAFPEGENVAFELWEVDVSQKVAPVISQPDSRTMNNQ
jgi:hypothetical protein